MTTVPVESNLLTIRFVSKEINYRNDDDNATRDGPFYTWSACAQPSNSRCDNFRGYSISTKNCKYNGLMPGLQEICMFPTYLSQPYTDWRGIKGVSNYARVSQSPQEFRDAIARRYIKGDWAARQGIFVYIDVSYTTSALWDYYTANNNDASFMYELINMWGKVPSGIEKTPENQFALDFLFYKACFLGNSNSFCTIWWNTVANNGTKTSICNDASNVTNPLCVRACSDKTNIINCDNGLLTFCSQHPDNEDLCGCFQQPSVTRAFFETLSAQLPEFEVFSNKQDACFYPPCASKSAQRPFNEKLKPVLCPTVSSCLQPINIKLHTQNIVKGQSILIENTCNMDTNEKLNCPVGYSQQQYDKLLRCCPNTANALSKTYPYECTYEENIMPIKNSLIVVFASIVLICLIVALRSEQ